jgi:hypothetical protein
MKSSEIVALPLAGKATSIWLDLQSVNSSDLPTSPYQSSNVQYSLVWPVSRGKGLLAGNGAGNAIARRLRTNRGAVEGGNGHNRCGQADNPKVAAVVARAGRRPAGPANHVNSLKPSVRTNRPSA